MTDKDNVKDIVYHFEKDILTNENTISLTYDDKQEKIKFNTNDKQIVHNAITQNPNFIQLQLIDITDKCKLQQNSRDNFVTVVFPESLPQNSLLKIVASNHGVNFSFDFTRDMTNHGSHDNNQSQVIHDFNEPMTYLYNCCLWIAGKNTIQLAMEMAANNFETKWNTIPLTTGFVKVYQYGLMCSNENH